MRRWLSLAIVLLVAGFAVRPLAGQTPTAAPLADSSAGPCGIGAPTAPASYPAGTVRRFNAHEVQTLFCLLRRDTSTWPDVRRYYFGATYTPRFADLIVFLDSGKIRQALIQNDGVVSDRVLRGERYVYVLLFSTQLMDSATDRVDTAKVEHAGRLHATLSVEDIQVDPLLSRVVTALLESVSFKVGGPAAAAKGDSTAADNILDLRDLRQDSTSAPLYAGFARFRLAVNTWDRLSLRPGVGRRFPRDQWTVTNFANASASPLGLSLALGVTPDARTMKVVNDTGVVPNGQDVRVNLYLLGHLYIGRSLLPSPHAQMRRAYSLFAGTNLLGGALLNELLAGISVDRLLSDLGVAVGVNVLPSVHKDKTETRVVRLFLGVQSAL